MKIKIVNKSEFPLPAYKTDGSAGIDLQANISSPVELKPFERYLVPTGLYIAIPKGYEGQIRGRSGLALKHGITLANGIGTIDSDYRGEIKVILINLSNESFIINKGDRIAQFVLNKYESIDFEEVDSLETTNRGKGGFGHTGI
ncbi:dUTP diphosphatase [Wansuia hejianensis]|uniref:Deoxyuridine 5'-triphosphate nucleotidohydrolase n=1 Tax=Wansuia hejianensis TaxID=2763667 RepID=A0A926INB3_9FIRM|nr:dUTP diphosphatase [Wansuia hejianensis]MBC8590518.1 dUTP diphosphatase [Wansuia hejianensis]